MKDMEEDIIVINNLTKDYGNWKGIFDVNIKVKKGEVFGLLGLNGAGKTTIIRNLMGFIKPDFGSCTIKGMDCFKKSALIQKSLGYLPEKLSFFEDMDGRQMINFMAAMKNVQDGKRIEELAKMFELNPKGKIKKMSKGTKQKLATICAFMNNPDVIILDEPTNHLDPLMQNRFIELILNEKKKGKTIFMSSHTFEEIEKTCDRTAIIENGIIVDVEDIETLNYKRSKSYTITLENSEDVGLLQGELNQIKIDKNHELNKKIDRLNRESSADTVIGSLETKQIYKDFYKVLNIRDNTITISVKRELSAFLNVLSHYNIKDIDITTPSLDEVFLHYYGGDKK